MRFFAIAALALLAAPAAAETRYDCVIAPSFEAELGSAVTGLVKEVLVDRGDWVEAGQVVARLAADSEEATSNAYRRFMRAMALV